MRILSTNKVGDGIGYGDQMRSSGCFSNLMRYARYQSSQLWTQMAPQCQGIILLLHGNNVNKWGDLLLVGRVFD